MPDCQTCGQALKQDAAACPECGAPAWPHPGAERRRELVGCPDCIGGMAEAACPSCGGKGCDGCEGGYALRRCGTCGGTGRLAREDYDGAEIARSKEIAAQAWEQAQAHREELGDMLRRNEQAALTRDAERRAEAEKRAAVERAAREKADAVLCFLSYPAAIVINVLYVALSHARIFTLNAADYDPISRWIVIAAGPLVKSSESSGCLGSLFALLLLLVLVVLHLAFCLLLWVPVALAIQAAIRRRK